MLEFGIWNLEVKCNHRGNIYPTHYFGFVSPILSCHLIQIHLSFSYTKFGVVLLVGGKNRGSWNMRQSRLQIWYACAGDEESGLAIWSSLMGHSLFFFFIF